MISVILPTYNRADIISKSVNSVLKQTYTDFELLVIDDGSNDNTEEIIKKFNDRRIRYIKNDTDKHGPAVARNIGIRECVGEYIAFNDSDDEWYEYKLEKQLNFLKEKNADIIFCVMHKKGKGKEQLIPDKNFSQNKCTVENILKGSFTGTPALFGKAKCLKGDLFDEKINSNEDWELVIRLIQRYKVIYQNEKLVEVSVTDNSVSTDCAAAIASMEYILSKHNDLYLQNKRSRKRMENAIKYHRVLLEDLTLQKKIRNGNNIKNYVKWLKSRIIRYAYSLGFLLEE